MNQTRPEPWRTSRSPLACLAGAVLVAGSLLGPAARGQGVPAAPELPADPFAPARPPAAALAPAPASASAVLDLLDGGTVPGVLVDSTRPGVVAWRAAGFDGPFQFPTAAIRSIHLPGAGAAGPAAGAFEVELTRGDRLFGSIVGLDDRTIEVDAVGLGRLRIDRARVARLRRWDGGRGLVYDGPHGLAGWRPVATELKPAGREEVGLARRQAVRKAADARPAAALAGAPAAPVPAGWVDAGGPIRSNGDRATVQADVGLPDRAAVDLELAWDGTPNFSIALGVTGEEPGAAVRAFRVEVWTGQLVALRETDKEADVAPLRPVENGPGTVALRLYLDQKLGRLVACSASGEILGDLKLGGAPDPGRPGGRAAGDLLAGVKLDGATGATGPCVRITNLRGGLRLDRLQVARWDGALPGPDAGGGRLRLADGATLAGPIERLDPATREFVVRSESGERRIAEGQVESARFDPPAADAGPSSAARVGLEDGTRLAGDWIGVEGGRLTLMSPGVASPVQLAIATLRSIDFGVGQAAPARSGDDAVGTLDLGGVRMEGRLVAAPGVAGAGAGRLAWQPRASAEAAPLRSDASGRVVYRASAPKPAPAQPQAVRRVVNGNFQGVTTVVPLRKALYLRTGDIVPAEVTKVDEAGVHFASPVLDRKFIPHDKVKAVELVAAEDPGAIAVSKAKLERLLTLPRAQKGSPPTHLLRSRNGDVLRGRLLALDDKTARVEVRLDEKELPRDRLARIIWLHADELDPAKKPANPGATGPTLAQAVRADGNRLTFRPEGVVGDAVVGTSDALGPCRVRFADLDALLLGGAVEAESAQLAYQQYRLHPAAEPRLPEDAGSGEGGTESPLVGKPAPAVELDTLDAKVKFRLADRKGEVVVLDFWATWCGPCIQAMPQVERVAGEFRAQGVRLVAVNLQEAPEAIRAMLERQKLTPEVALDRDGAVARKYGANAIPQTVVIDRDGVVRRVFVGGGPHLGDQLREAIQALMPPT